MQLLSLEVSLSWDLWNEWLAAGRADNGTCYPMFGPGSDNQSIVIAIFLD